MLPSSGSIFRCGILLACCYLPSGRRAKFTLGLSNQLAQAQTKLSLEAKSGGPSQHVADELNRTDIAIEPLLSEFARLQEVQAVAGVSSPTIQYEHAASTLQPMALHAQLSSKPVASSAAELVLLAVISCGSGALFGATGFGGTIVLQWGYYVLSLFGMLSDSIVAAESIMVLIPVLQVLLLFKSLNLGLGLTLGLSSLFAFRVVTIFVSDDRQWVTIATGVLFLLMWVWFALVERRSNIDRNGDPPEEVPEVEVKRHLGTVLTTGLLAGMLCGFNAVPSPSLILFALVSRIGRNQLRCTCAFIFTFFIAPARLLGLGGRQLDFPSLGWQCAVGFIGGAAGLLLGNAGAARMSHLQWRWSILCVLLGYGLSYLLGPALGLQKL